MKPTAPPKPVRPEPSPLRVVREGGEPWLWPSLCWSFARMGMAIGWLCSRLVRRVCDDAPPADQDLSFVHYEPASCPPTPRPSHVFPASSKGGPAGMPPAPHPYPEPRTGTTTWR